MALGAASRQTIVLRPHFASQKQQSAQTQHVHVEVHPPKCVDPRNGHTAFLYPAMAPAPPTPPPYKTRGRLRITRIPARMGRRQRAGTSSLCARLRLVLGGQGGGGAWKSDHEFVAMTVRRRLTSIRKGAAMARP
eukprot:363185-Chlamydomonas_euryale.AAC.3